MKVGRYLLYLLIGGIIGGMIGTSIGMLSDGNTFGILHFASYNFTIIVTIIASLINIGLILAIWKASQTSLKYKHKTENASDANLDQYEQKANLTFMRTGTLYYITILVALLNIFIIALGNGPSSILFLVIVPFILTLIPSTMLGFFYRKFDTRMPKQGEANYTERILQNMDEGERHITLESMFKVYHVNISLIMVGAMFLGIFSITTGINQAVGIGILIILFAYNTFGYMLKVRKFYKS
ncbi:DUF3169 family protein [Staphylococcus haemolyticus]|uniref:DUF3169 family protein n=1 Tax=Staphylococcus haemolyticus TaxID=1283 RepID=UPI00069DDCE9|nr:DUF3169 family protein [Staphylococcus haemolyticus]MDT0705498.1 DUF3169 family protein [Staphylococcus haemolyticus]MDT0738677.1 DUF3169 family protein [Staphylococcus haemolyticus]PTK74409.1 DUF3169 domain-containing protein [Staphylococcus haemolyticus]PTL13131.1 DUF3169 domain-containing protein [Staphylococcus haemolyticus]RIO58326.1 DUF3169 family protein [Staphylococcus haemolyticus]